MDDNPLPLPAPSAEAALAGPTAAILLIGEEILSGKVVDENARFLTRELRALGVLTRRIEVVPDAIDEIAPAVQSLSSRFDHVFTSGGVGATHDDVTMAAVARAFGRTLARHVGLEALIRRGMGVHLTERDLRMADVPEGAALVGDEGGHTWPVVTVANVFIFPGVPSILKRKFNLVRDRLRAPPIFAHAVYCNASEGQIAADLDAVVAAFPTVVLGSYPHLDATDYQVKLTLDSRDPAALAAAKQELTRRLAAAVVRSE